MLIDLTYRMQDLQRKENYQPFQKLTNSRFKMNQKKKRKLLIKGRNLIRA